MFNIPGYRIERELGRGGMATVYLAQQETLRRLVALKVMSPALAVDPSFTNRFLKEGATMARLVHPNIIKVFDSGINQNLYYLAMEYLPGGSLSERIDRGLGTEESLTILRAMANALHYAHSQGVIHRDIKPQNILHYEDGTPVLTDFGIAKLLSSSTAMTATGFTPGTPRYMSPEQIRGQAIDARVDIYALGILFYQMLTGQVPFTAPDNFAIAFKHLSEPVPRLPAPLTLYQPLLEAMLAKDPEDRLPSARALLDYLNALGITSTGLHTKPHGLPPASATAPPAADGNSTDPPSGSRRWLAIGLLAGLVGIAATIGITQFNPPRAPADVAEYEILARAEAERQARMEAEQQAQLETERLEAARRAREEAERQARLEAEHQARLEAERLEAARRARAEAERQVQLETEHQARLAAERQEAERQARLAAERLETERLARAEAERQARLAAERQREAERLAREETERLARLEAERQEAERLASAEAERQARLAAERQEAERQARLEAERQREAERLAREEAERLARLEAERQEAERLARQEAEHIERDLGLDPGQRRTIQEALTALGFSTRGADGVFGPNTRSAIAAYQAARQFQVTRYLTGEQVGRLLDEAREPLARLESQRRAEQERQAAAVQAPAPRPPQPTPEPPVTPAPSVTPPAVETPVAPRPAVTESPQIAQRRQALSRELERLQRELNFVQHQLSVYNYHFERDRWLRAERDLRQQITQTEQALQTLR